VNHTLGKGSEIYDLQFTIYAARGDGDVNRKESGSSAPGNGKMGRIGPMGRMGMLFIFNF
jgi:hypothetical protein